MSRMPSLPSGASSLCHGALQDYLEFNVSTLTSLSRSALLLASPGEGLPALHTHLATALANKATYLDGLASASGSEMDGLLACAHITNFLSLVANGGGGGGLAGWGAMGLFTTMERSQQPALEQDEAGGEDQQTIIHDVVR